MLRERTESGAETKTVSLRNRFPLGRFKNGHTVSLPNQILKGFVALDVLVSNLHRFSIDFVDDFCLAAFVRRWRGFVVVVHRTFAILAQERAIFFFMDELRMASL